MNPSGFTVGIVFLSCLFCIRSSLGAPRCGNPVGSDLRDDFVLDVLWAQNRIYVTPSP